MDDYQLPNCEDCNENLVQVEGEWYCPACDSESGFELVPQNEDFVL